MWPNVGASSNPFQEILELQNVPRGPTLGRGRAPAAAATAQQGAAADDAPVAEEVDGDGAS
eukprot:7039123-Pyramimonas_sp.AAC.1